MARTGYVTEPHASNRTTFTTFTTFTHCTPGSFHWDRRHYFSDKQL